jgi:hypothetical protein
MITIKEQYSTIKAGKTRTTKVFKCCNIHYTGISHARYNNKDIHADDFATAKERFKKYYGQYPDSIERM